MKKIDLNLNEKIYFCECKEKCFRRATQKHHKFPQSKRNRKLYGSLIDADDNIQLVSHDHHARCKNISEIEFCKLLNIEPRGKVYRFKKFDFGRT